MKKTLSLIFLCFLSFLSAHSQFTTTPDAQGNIHTLNSGFVGIGAPVPTASLEIASTANNWGSMLHVGINGNMANTQAQILSSLAVLGGDQNSQSSVGATAWNYYNKGNQPSWSGALLIHSGTGITGNYCGMPAANQATLLFQNISSGVIATNGANLHIAPGGNNVAMSFLTNGNVGVGVTNPQIQMHVKGSSAATNYDASNNLVGFTQLWPDNALIWKNNGSGSAFRFGTADNLGAGNWMEFMRFNDAGNMLIGKTSQSNSAYKLDVNGGIRANKVVVNTSGADFVFDSAYHVRPLPEVEAYISQNHHLPDIQPAKEMQKEGVDVGDNQSRLLQKVEELTLYLIQQNKMLQQQAQLLQTQQEKIDQLERRLNSASAGQTASSRH